MNFDTLFKKRDPDVFNALVSRFCVIQLEERVNIQYGSCNWFNFLMSALVTMIKTPSSNSITGAPIEETNTAQLLLELPFLLDLTRHNKNAADKVYALFLLRHRYFIEEFLYKDKVSPMIEKLLGIQFQKSSMSAQTSNWLNDITNSPGSFPSIPYNNTNTNKYKRNDLIVEKRDLERIPSLVRHESYSSACAQPRMDIPSPISEIEGSELEEFSEVVIIGGHNYTTFEEEEEGNDTEIDVVR
eukprot:GAHX01002518.1.p1 GENE.GAHX01002518.1~~GAHX01002518.1.p1  ORF type:complete len:243 (+),score=21.55 GAHX01002518.1:215-943(+)